MSTSTRRPTTTLLDEPSASDIATVARRIWSAGERREGRETVRAVLTVYRALIENRRKRLLAFYQSPKGGAFTVGLTEAFNS